MSERALELIAETAVGDARTAIRLLRQGAVAAEQAGNRKLDVHALGDVADQAAEADRASRLATLTEDHKVLYRILERFGQLTAGALFEQYKQRCAHLNRKPIALRTFSGYANQLVQAGLVDRDIVRGKSRERLFRIVR